MIPAFLSHSHANVVDRLPDLSEHLTLRSMFPPPSEITIQTPWRSLAGFFCDFRARIFRPFELIDYIGGLVFVDGRQINKPWYIDVDAGIVKDYDIFRDDQFRTAHYPLFGPALGADVEIVGELYSRTIRGHVTLVTREDRARLLPGEKKYKMSAAYIAEMTELFHEQNPVLT